MMAELLFIKPEELTEFTILGGNVDVDKYLPCILNVQLTIIEPMLGENLYNKIVSDIESDTLTGKYKEIFDNYVKPIVKNEATAQYIKIASYVLANAGLLKHQPENTVIVDKQETVYLSQTYSSTAQMYVLRFEKWIGKQGISEWSSSRCGSNGDTKLTYGWKL